MSAEGERDENRIATGQRLHPHVVTIRRDRVRHAPRRDALAVLEDRVRANGAVGAHGPHTARSLPARDPEDPARLHGLRPGASYTEPALRRAIVEFLTTLDITDVTLAGESLGATVSLTASSELEDRVRRVVAFNPYDYPQGVGRANRVASIYVSGARLPAVGPMVTRMENKPVLGIVLRGGLSDGSKLPDHYLAELRRVGRRRGYPRVAREVFRNVESMIAARALYGRVTVPVALIYGDHDWSRLPEREANLALLRGARSISLPDTGHFSALEQPDRIADILLDSSGA